MPNSVTSIGPKLIVCFKKRCLLLEFVRFFKNTSYFEDNPIILDNHLAL